jgi:uncharacterized lipoprotein YmbA
MTLAAVSLLTACANAPEAALIALPSVPRPDDSMQAAADERNVLLVRSLTVPEYMRSRRVRYWADPETVAQWPDAYWAERIEVGMTREFIAALRAALPRWRICEANCGDSTPAISLTVDLLRLDLVRRQHEILVTAQPAISDTAVPPSPARLDPIWHLATPVTADSAQGEAQAIATMLDSLAQRAAVVVKQARVLRQAAP